MENELFVSVFMNDGSCLHDAKLGFLDNNNYFDWITDKEELLRIINNQEDRRHLAFSTFHVQGKLIKQNIKDIWFK